MIHVIVGQSGAGKTTFVKTNFIKDNTVELVKDDVYYTKAGDRTFLLGKYNIGIRTEGTDTLSYNALPKIKQVVEKLAKIPDADIVIEGDRITNSSMMDFLLLNKYDVKLYLVVCPIEESKRRLQGAGSKISDKFIRTTQTKSRNLFEKYKHYFGGEIIYNPRKENY